VPAGEADALDAAEAAAPPAEGPSSPRAPSGARVPRNGQRHKFFFLLLFAAPWRRCGPNSSSRAAEGRPRAAPAASAKKVFLAKLWGLCDEQSPRIHSH